MNRSQEIFRVALRGLLLVGSGMLIAWDAGARGFRGPASEELHPLVQSRPDHRLPRVTLNRFFETGGYETLSLYCRPERTEKSDHLCAIERSRNGFSVAETRVDYGRTRQWMKDFFDQVKKIEREPLPESSTGRSLHMRQALIGWDIAFEYQGTQGQILRHQKTERSDVVKWILSLEGKLAAEFYRGE